MALNRRVSLQQRGSTQDAWGQPVETWGTVANLWAELMHPSGIEQIKGGADTSIIKASIKINRRPGVTAGMRVVHGQMIYDIEAVLPDEIDRQYLFLVCEVVT